MKKCLAALTVLFAVASAHAALTIQSCSINSASINFGVYNPLDPNPDDNNAGQIQISCTVNGNGAPVPVEVSLGVSGGTLAQRRLTNGSSFLNYNIYTNSTFTTIWGDGTAGTSTQTRSISRGGNSASWVLYGRIPAGQLSVAPGVFTDSVQVTLVW